MPLDKAGSSPKRKIGSLVAQRGQVPKFDQYFWPRAWNISVILYACLYNRDMLFVFYGLVSLTTLKSMKTVSESSMLSHPQLALVRR